VTTRREVIDRLRKEQQAREASRDLALSLVTMGVRVATFRYAYKHFRRPGLTLTALVILSLNLQQQAAKRQAELRRKVAASPGQPADFIRGLDALAEAVQEEAARQRARRVGQRRATDKRAEETTFDRLHGSGREG
jgi:hypothetical protein